MSYELKDIHWLSSPLAIKQRRQVADAISRTFHRKAPSFLLPQNERHLANIRFTGQIKHWALEIEGVCYEVQVRSWQKLKALRLFTDIGTASFHAADEWKRFRDDNEVKYERWKVGQTRMTHEQILDRLQYIWDRYNHDIYLFFVQNCQNFTKMLFESITISKDDPGISDEERSLWRVMPDPASYMIALGAKTTLFGGGGVHSTIGLARLTLASLAPSAEAVRAGVMAAAGGAEAAAGVTAGAAIEDSTGTGGAVAGSHGSATAAGKAGIGAKSSLGAKLGLSGQGFLHGAAGAKAMAAAKVAGVVALSHPVVAAGAVGLGALAAAAQRDNEWVRTHRKDLHPEIRDEDDVVLVDEKQYEGTTLGDAILAEDELLMQQQQQ